MLKNPKKQDEKEIVTAEEAVNEEEEELDELSEQELEEKERREMKELDAESETPAEEEEAFTENAEEAVEKPADDSTRELSFILLKDKTFAVRIGKDRSLETVVIPAEHKGKTVTEIEDKGFRNCQKLVSVTMPATLRRIGVKAFDGCAKALFKEEKNVIYVGNRAVGFNKKGAGADVVLRPGTLGVADGAFAKQKGIKTVSLPDGCAHIGRGAFLGCAGLKSVRAGKGLVSIRREAFFGCRALKEIKLPDGVSFIGEKAFEKCASLKAVSLTEGLIYLGEKAFSDCGLTSLVLPNGLDKFGKRAFANNKKLKTVRILGKAESVSDGMFSGCSSLRSAEIPNGAKSIGVAAFSGCGLKEFVLPDGCKTVYRDAFSACSKLETVRLNADLKACHDRAFVNCRRLKSLVLSDDCATAERIPSAFRTVSTVTLPIGVTKIASYAFCRLDGLKTLIFQGKKSAWKSVKKGKNPFSGKSVPVIQCSNGKISL